MASLTSILTPWEELWVAEQVTEMKGGQVPLFFLEQVAVTMAGVFRLKSNIKNYAFLRVQNNFFKFAYYAEKIYVRYIQDTDEYIIFKKNSEGNFLNVITNETVQIAESELISFQWDENKFRYVLWREFAKDLMTLKIISLNSMIMDGKKIIRYLNTDNKELADREKKLMMDYNDPFLDVQQLNGSENVIPSELQELNLGMSKGQTTFNNMTAYFNWFASLMGWVTSAEQKAERKTFAEGQIDMSNTIALQQLTMNNLDVFAHDVLQKWPSQNLEFEITNPLSNNDLNSGQPNQEQPPNINNTEGEAKNDI